MKTWGIILIVFGSLSFLGAMLAAASGRSASGGGLVFAVLGAYLIHRGKQKDQEETERKEWRDDHNHQSE